VVIYLDVSRARQILESKENIDVLYHGAPVWIEGISDNSIAEITKLQGLKQRIEVPVNMLEEKPQQ